MKKRKIIVIGGEQMSVQEVLDRLWYSNLDIEKVQVVGEGDRVGQIHEFKDSPALVISPEYMAEEDYDLAVMLTKMDNMEKVTSDMVFGNIPFIDMAGAFEPSADVPLLLPELNAFQLPTLPMIGVLPKGHLHALATIASILSNQCDVTGVTGLVVNGVSAAGSRSAMDELFEQTRSILGFSDVQKDHFPHQIAFNTFHDTKTELDSPVHHSILQYAMGCPDGSVSVDMAWTSHFVGVLGSIWIDFADQIDVKDVRRWIESEAGCVLTEDFGGALGVVGKDEISISNVKMVYNNGKRLTLRFGMDNLRRGLATSLIRLLEKVWMD